MAKLIYSIILLFSFCAKAQQIDVRLFTDTCIKPLYKYTYLTCADIIFSVDGITYIVPKHFKTDLASIPRLCWSIMSPAHSGSFRAAIIHDWLYYRPCYFSRLQADLIFYNLLRLDGLSITRSYIMYYAVRMFGWPFYNTGVCNGAT